MPLPPDLAAAADQEIARAEVFSFDVDLFQQHIGSGDLFNVIIRAQLYLEHVLISTLLDAFHEPSAINLRRLNFPSKLDLCIALGLLPAEWGAPVRKINEMRNHVAHRLDVEFNANVKSDLWRSLPEFLKEAILADKKAEVDERGEPSFPHMFSAVILWLDIARQKAQASRISGKYSEEYLRRTLERVGQRHSA